MRVTRQPRQLHSAGVRRIRLRGALAILALAGVASIPASPLTAHASTRSADGASLDGSGCKGVSDSLRSPLPPVGYAYTMTTTLRSDCTFSSPVLTLVRDPQPPAGGNLQATSYFRLWDCCNNKLNASATTLNWGTANGKISSASSVIHDYWFPDGWTQLHLSDNWTGGCIGCSSISAEGSAEFLFAPFPAFHNYDWNFITAQGNGGYSNCYSQWVWNLGAPGWTVQAWCGWGYGGT
jgi:hypothetical protein